MDMETRTQMIWDMMGANFTGDHDRAIDLLNEIAYNSDANEMFSVCCGVASLGKQVLEKLMLPQGISFAPGVAAAYLNPEVVREHENTPDELFALRFIGAVTNGDIETASALYDVALEAPGDQFTASVCSLVVAVTGMLCELEDHKKADGNPEVS